MAKDNPKLNLKEDSTDLYVLLPHNSFDDLTKFESKLAADQAYQKEGAAVDFESFRFELVKRCKEYLTKN